MIFLPLKDFLFFFIFCFFFSLSDFFLHPSEILHSVLFLSAWTITNRGAKQEKEQEMKSSSFSLSLLPFSRWTMHASFFCFVKIISFMLLHFIFSLKKYSLYGRFRPSAFFYGTCIIFLKKLGKSSKKYIICSTIFIFGVSWPSFNKVSTTQKIGWNHLVSKLFK